MLRKCEVRLKEFRKDKGRGKKALCVLLAAVMAGALLTGCGNKNSSDKAAEGAAEGQEVRGRYVEQEVTLPEQIDPEGVWQIFRSGEKLHLLVQQNLDGAAGMQEWELDGDSFSDVTEEWLKQISRPYHNTARSSLMRGSDGTGYLFDVYPDADGENYTPHLWKGQADGTAVEITPESWKVPDEQYGFYDYPTKITLLDDGIIAGMYYDRMEYYSAQDGSPAGEMPLAKSYADLTELSGGRFGLAIDDGYGSEAGGIEVYGSKSPDLVRSIPLDQEKNRSCQIASLLDDTLIAFNGDGIFRCRPDGAEWEKLIDGSDTKMALVNVGCASVAALADGVCYGLFLEDGMKRSLMRYIYDENAVAVATETLEIYSVYDSFLLQQAAALYHRAHPEVIVEIETAGNYAMYGEDLDFQQIFQSLNTRLLAGDGPDILVMDGLDMESFEDKGLLADINDVVGPLEEQGALLDNITGSYLREDGKRYEVPLQFGMVMAIGRQVDVETMKDLPSLAAALSETEESLMGPVTPQELVERFLPYFVEELVDGKELNKEALRTNLEYLKAIGDNCGIIQQRGKDEFPYNVWDLTFRAKLVFYEASGYQQAMLPISIANFAKGGYVPFANAYFPSLQMGIYSKSEKQDLAKEFLAYVLSEEIQNEDHYEGYPVNAKSLEYQKTQDRSDAEAFTSIEVAEGMYEEFKIGVFPEDDAEKLAAACKQLNKRAGRDKAVEEKIAEAVPAYLAGTQSLEDTVSQIESGLRMYLAE